MASWMLCSELGLGHDPKESVAYIGNWVQKLKEDPMEIFRAARDADKIRDYSMAFERGKDVHKEQEMPQEKSQEKEPPKRAAEKKTFLAVPYSERTGPSPTALAGTARKSSGSCLKART